MGLKDSVDAVWTAAKSLLNSKIDDEQQGTQFYEWGEWHARRTRKNISVLSRTVTFEAGAVQLVLGELSVLFGCMVQSGDMADGKQKAEELGYWLAEVFMADQFLGSVARDTRIDAIELDFESPEAVSSRDMKGDPQQWVGVTVVWELQYSRS